MIHKIYFLFRSSSRFGLGFLFFICSSLSVYGQVDDSDQQAVKQTQDFLKNKKERDEYKAKSKSAHQADDQLSALGFTEEESQAVYELSAEVFSGVAGEGGASPEKMLRILAEYQRNPASFASKWTPEQKAKLKALAEKLDHKNVPLKQK